MFDISMSADLTYDGILAEAGLEPGGPVQEAIDNAVVEYSKPYWAWDTGNLANSAEGMGSGRITYTADYAYELYYGVRADGSPINYHHDKNPMAGAFPIERMQADHMNDIIEEAQKVARNYKQH